MSELMKAAKVAVEQCLNIKKEERVLVVIDTPQKEIGNALVEASRGTGAETMLIEMSPRDNHGQEPPSAVAAAMLEADIVIMPTTKSLSHTNARRNANKAGARIASMPLITVDLMTRTLGGDYSKMAEKCITYASLLKDAKEVRITSPNGTDLTMTLVGREIHVDNGIIHKSGDIGNLPAGEVYAAPLEGTTKGTLVIDGSMAGIGLLNEPLRMKVENGYVKKIEGKDATELKNILDKNGQDAYNIGELGLGMNERATVTGNVLEDEKILGTVHIALGDNTTMGGIVAVPSHLDGVILSPTVIVDGKTILSYGKLLF